MNVKPCGAPAPPYRLPVPPVTTEGGHVVVGDLAQALAALPAFVETMTVRLEDGRLVRLYIGNPAEDF